MCREALNQKGIGLIELMISITLGLFLISGAIGVLVSSKSSYNLNSSLTLIQDNARFATSTLNRDVRMAGFFGCSTAQGFNSTLNPAPSGSGWYMDFDNAVSGWDGDDPGYPDSEFPDAYNSQAASGMPTSDILTIRRSDGTDVEVADNDPPSSATIDIVGTHPYEDGDILVITDCEQTTVFQVTGGNSNKIVHNTGTGSPGNCTKFLGGVPCSSAAANKKIFRGDDGAFIVQIKSHAYYVTEGGDGAPALFRRELVANSGNPDLIDEEFVQGVENIQVFYGYDSDGDGFANRYVDADEIAAIDWPNVVTVRTHFLIRSFSQVASEPQDFRFVGETFTPDDRFLRQEFISTVELRNKG